MNIIHSLIGLYLDGFVTDLIENSIHLLGCNAASGSFFQRVIKQFPNRTISGPDSLIDLGQTQYNSTENRFSFFSKKESTNDTEENTFLYVNA